MDAASLETLEYFHGMMSSEKAERVLDRERHRDGCFLLRLSPRKANSYALAFTHHGRIIHHKIHEVDGKFQISGGRLHSSIAHLVRYHTKSRSRMLTLLKWPHKREPGRGPFIWPHVTSDQMKRETTKLLTAELTTNRARTCGELQDEIRRRVFARAKRDMHMCQPWFFRNMSRSEADQSLWDNEQQMDGTFLLRENEQRRLVLSVLCRNETVHYQIYHRVTTDQREKYSIHGLQSEFDCVMDLIAMCHSDGLGCILTEPCTTRAPPPPPSAPRPGPLSGPNPPACHGTQSDARPVCERRPGPTRRTEIQFQSSPDRGCSPPACYSAKSATRVAFQFDQLAVEPWYFDVMTRADAESRLREQGSEDGIFLVRRGDKGRYALSLIFQGAIKHYRIWTRPRNKFSIDSINAEFNSIVDLVNVCRYTGLDCPLGKPCSVRRGSLEPATPARPSMPRRSSLSSPSLASSPLRPAMRHNETWPANHSPSDLCLDIAENYLSPFGEESVTCLDELDGAEECPDMPDLFEDVLNPAYHQNEDSSSSDGDGVEGEMGRQLDEGEEGDFDFERREDYDPQSLHPYLDFDTSSRESEVYCQVPSGGDGVFNIESHQLTLQGHLGKGQFGTVQVAIYELDGKQSRVAVKSLVKQDVSEDDKYELVREADVMRTLDNPFIIRLVGLCCSEDSIMLVMEYAADGPLNTYLRKHKDMNMTKIIQLIREVAEGMAYLESRSIVHRDLAARNILLLPGARQAKICDFGLSRSFDNLKDYYRSSPVERLPLRWYPPECFTGLRFDSKSDVWSFGVTMWEATSYAERPYKGMRLEECKEQVQRGYRLSKPAKCPPAVYDVMQQCWQHQSRDRPTFQQIIDDLKSIE